MTDTSNSDVKKLTELILELDKIIHRLAAHHDDHDTVSVTARLHILIKGNVNELQDLVIKLGRIIYALTKSTFIQGIVNSLLDCMSVDETLYELKIINGQHQKEETAGNSWSHHKFLRMRETHEHAIVLYRVQRFNGMYPSNSIQSCKSRDIKTIFKHFVQKIRIGMPIPLIGV